VNPELALGLPERIAVVLAAFGPALPITVVITAIGLRQTSLRVAQTALAGGVLSIGIVLLLFPVMLLAMAWDAGPARNVATAFFGAAIPEEAAKLFVLAVIVLRRRDADFRRDAIFCGGLIGLGFALVENFLYVSSAQDWLTVASLRATLAVPGHVIWGLVMGALVVRAAMGRGSWLSAFLVPMMLHGFYNSSVFLFGDFPETGFTGQQLIAIALFILTLLATWALVVALVAPVWSETSDLPPAFGVVRDMAALEAAKAPMIVALALTATGLVLAAPAMGFFVHSQWLALAALAVLPWCFVEFWHRV
jgi:RsiW-degrading membrane proteinase PrsW (M82 family)